MVENALEAGYREMAADHEREAEAEEWCEGAHWGCVCKAI